MNGSAASQSPRIDAYQTLTDFIREELQKIATLLACIFAKDIRVISYAHMLIITHQIFVSQSKTIHGCFLWTVVILCYGVSNIAMLDITAAVQQCERLLPMRGSD